MNSRLLEALTKSPLRKSLYHFTRYANLRAIARLDALYPSSELVPAHSGGIRREAAVRSQYKEHIVVANAHLRIRPEAMAADTTGEEFRSFLDRHVFLWPTRRYCEAMAAMYARREPDEAFAILQFDAYTLLQDHYHSVKLSKYDSGSSPRFLHRVSYRKSCRMFLPLASLPSARDRDVPTKPSEIKEVLVEGAVSPLSRYLEAVYTLEAGPGAPEWIPLTESLHGFLSTD